MDVDRYGPSRPLSAVLTLTPSDGRGPLVVAPGTTATIGRTPAPGVDAPTAAPHLGLSANPRLHAHAATATVDAGGWALTNTGRWLHVRVVEVGGPNHLDVPPGRSLRVPHPECDLEIALGDELVALRASCPAMEVTPAGDPAVSGATVGGLGLDPSTGYFLALVALCEPRLRDPRSDEVAAVPQVVARLNRVLPAAERVTAKAVERRLAHVRSKLGIGAEGEHGGSAAGLEVRDATRRAIDLVLRTGTVTVADLARLDPPPRAPSG